MAGGRIIIPNADPVYQSPGVPAVGATLSIYNTGTGTLASIFTTIGLNTPQSNPLVSDTNGLFYEQSTGIFADASMAYDAVLNLPDGSNYPYSGMWPITTPPDTSNFLQNPSVVLTGTPTAPTPTAGDNSSKIATTEFVNTFASSINAVPAGLIGNFAMTAVPNGWLICDGAAVSRSTYARLFSVIGTTWGIGDGSTTFNVPNLGGYFVRGWTSTQSPDSGRAFASVQTDQITDHNHTWGTSQFVKTGTVSTYSSGGNNPVWNNPTGAFTGNAVAIPGITTYIGTETRPINVAMIFAVRT